MLENAQMFSEKAESKIMCILWSVLLKYWNMHVLKRSEEYFKLQIAVISERDIGDFYTFHIYIWCYSRRVLIFMRISH